MNGDTGSNKRLARKLVIVTIAMFGFGYALIPLYNIMCDLTGINGKTGRMDAQATTEIKVDRDRWVTVQFLSNVNQGMPWEFRPAVTSMRVRPGEVVTTTYYAHNTSDEIIVGQAVPSVVPNVAAAYFKKIECFCFTRQELKPQEAKSMPVQYVVQPDLPADVKTITLSYTFFNTDKASAKKYGGGAADVAHADHAHH